MRVLAWLCCGLCLIMVAASCEPKDNPSTGTPNGGPAAEGTGQSSSAAVGGISFSDRSEVISFTHTDGNQDKYWIVETLASGVGLFDYDDDGDLDIYMLNGTPLPVPLDKRMSDGPRNALFRNDGNLKFVDVTEEAGVPGHGFSVGCATGDFDNDGDLDLYITSFGPNYLYENLGDGKFRDVTIEQNVDVPAFSAAASFVDIDNDGDLDLYVSNYCEPNFASEPCLYSEVPGYCAPGRHAPIPDSLFLNEGGKFRDISESSGIGKPKKWGMGIVTSDFDGDGKMDLYVANDVSDNFLWRNLGDGRFENIAIDQGIALSANGDEQGSMGVAAADYDLDGKQDLLITNYQKQLNALYHRDGPEGFTDLATAHGLGVSCFPMVSWGVGFADFDHDMWPDLFIANGHLEDRIAEYDDSSPYLQKNQLFRNNNGRFVEIGPQAGSGLQIEKSSRGAAFGDLDGDGDLDIVVCNSRDKPSVLIRDGAPTQSWILVDARTPAGAQAIGARVEVIAGGRTQIREIRSGNSYCSQNDLRAHFGLGSTETIDRIRVHWADGTTSEQEKVAVNRVLRIQKSE